MTDQTPTDEQIAAARHAGWDVGEPGSPGYPIAPPDGWDAHGVDPGPVAVIDVPGETP